MVAQREPRRISIDEWRALELQTPDAKYEYIDGLIYLMAGGSLAHARISSNAVRALEDTLGEHACFVYNSDAGVRLSETRYMYPDATVSCDLRDRPTTEQTEVLAPRIVIEVLSDSTEGKDRITKAHLYHACPTIREYMLIATRYQAVEAQRRINDEWTIHLFGASDEIELVSIGVRFPVAALYRGTMIPEMPNDQHSSRA